MNYRVVLNILGKVLLAEALLLLLQPVNLLLDGALRKKLDDVNIAGLADAVATVRRLVFHRGIPPGIHVDNHVGSDEV